MKKETMTSRQRVIETINHRVPDRMPIDLGMYTATNISAFAYWNLLEYLNLPTNNVEIVDGVQLTVRVEDEVMKRFHCDCVFLKPKLKNTKKWNPRGKYEFIVPDYYNPEKGDKGQWKINKNGRNMLMPVGGFFFDGDWINMEDSWDDDFFNETVYEAKRIYEETDYFTVFRGFHPFFNSDINFFCDMTFCNPANIGITRRLAERSNRHRNKCSIHSHSSCSTYRFYSCMPSPNNNYIKMLIFLDAGKIYITHVIIIY
jgi:uroporphyrinogen decarboxylase